MSVRYLLDTNVVSEPVKRTPNAGLVKRFEKARSEVAIASLVWNELLYGCFRLPASKRRNELEQYLFGVVAPSIPILPYDASAADWHARERARLSNMGTPPPFIDGQIAAIAKTHRLILVTANVSHYEAFEALAIEDWRT